MNMAPISCRGCPLSMLDPGAIELAAEVDYNTVGNSMDTTTVFRICTAVSHFEYINCVELSQICRSRKVPFIMPLSRNLSEVHSQRRHRQLSVLHLQLSDMMSRQAVTQKANEHTTTQAGKRTRCDHGTPETRSSDRGAWGYHGDTCAAHSVFRRGRAFMSF